MLRIIQNQNAAAAASYYSQADYYSDGQELIGLWGGQAAELLGLSGIVDREAFQALCENRHPVTEEQLTARTRTDRTVGYDLNFHSPKSVSLLYALTRDERILEAFRASVDETMKLLEPDAKTRVRKRGEMSERSTGNLAWAEFVHFTSRPVDGVPDPHLHAHCFTFNCTFDDHEQAWKAVQFRDIKRDAPFFEAAFHASLADRLCDLGYHVRRTGKFWEIDGIENAITKKFSKRTELIEEQARLKNVTDPDRKSELGAATREAKSKELTQTELQQEWLDRLTNEQYEQIQAVQQTSLVGPKPLQTITPQQALQFAMDHCFERESVVPTRKLLETALRYGVGNLTLGDLERELPNSDLILRDWEGRGMATTPAVLAEERRMLAFARDGKATRAPLNPSWEIQRTNLNTEQRAAVHLILNSDATVTLLRGKAGTGKTVLTKEAVEAIEAAGKPVLMLASSVEASRVVLRGQGFATADTVAQFLKSPKLAETVRDGVLWVDEVGLLGIRDLVAVFDKAQELNARIVLAGDSRQHSAVQRGDALRLLEREAGLKAAELRTIHRQKGDYAAAVSLIASGQVLKGFDALDKLGWIEELSAEERAERVAAEYADAVKQKKEILVVAPTHAESEPLVAAIREKLKSTLDRHGKPLLAKDDREFLRLESKQLTEAEKRDPHSFEAGDVLFFTQNARGYKRGTRLIYNEELAGKLAELAPRIEVYRPSNLPLATGEQIRITGPGTTLDGHRLHNGSKYQVKRITPVGEIVLNNGWRLAADFGLIAPSFVSTSHAAQGRSIKGKVILCQSELSRGAASQNQFYVSVSRSKENCLILCDSKEELRDQIQRDEQRLTATELVRPNRKQLRTRFINRLTNLVQTVQSQSVSLAQQLTRKTVHAR